MGSSHGRRWGGALLLTAILGGGGWMALADAPAGTAPPVPPTAATAPANKEGDSASTKPASQPSSQPSAPVHLVKPGKLSFTVQGEGSFVADEPFEARLKFNTHSGPLTIVSAAANRATVKKGDTILEIDPFYINKEVAAAENELAVAKAGLTKAESDSDLGEKADALAMRIQQNETKNAEAAVRWWEKVDGPHMLELTELQVRLSRANVEDQQDELDQLRKMYKGEELTTQTADIVVKRALRQLDIGKVSLKMAEERGEKTENHTYPISKQAVVDALDQSKQRLSMLQATQAQAAVLRKAALSTARLSLSTSEKKLADLKKDQELFAIKAPSDGVVLYGYSSGGSWTGGDPKTMKPGEKLTSGQTVMTLFKPGDLKVEMTLQESQSAWVTEAARAEVKPVAFPELNYDGKCSAPGPKAGAAGLTFATSIGVGAVDARVLPGMKANVRITGADVDGVLLVPVSAVSNNKVWVRKDGQEVEREVVTGRSDGKMIEIRKGVTDGEEVLREAKK